MLFLLIFTGYWIVFWQQYITLPGYIHRYINVDAPVEKILFTDGAAVVCLTLLINYLIRKIPPFQCGSRRRGTTITFRGWRLRGSRGRTWDSRFCPSASGR
jgi:hypothetical protein